MQTAVFAVAQRVTQNSRINITIGIVGIKDTPVIGVRLAQQRIGQVIANARHGPVFGAESRIGRVGEPRTRRVVQRSPDGRLQSQQLVVS